MAEDRTDSETEDIIKGGQGAHFVDLGGSDVIHDIDQHNVLADYADEEILMERGLNVEEGFFG